MPDNSEDKLGYVTTNLFKGRASDFGAFSAQTPQHSNMLYHQVIIIASGAIAAGIYKVRFSVFEGESQLEYTAWSGKYLSFTGGKSAVATFAAHIRGIHLEVDTALSGGETISCVLSSSTLPFDATGDVTDGPVADTSVPLEGWRDLRASLVSGEQGVSDPVLTAFGPGATVKQLAFSVGDVVYVGLHVDHDYKIGSTAYVHMHWSTDGTSVNPVKWRMTHSIAKGHDQASFSTDVITDLEQAAAGTAWRHMITEDTVGMELLEPDTLVVMKIERITNGGTENADTVFGLFADIHYEVQQYATPNRVPDFYT